MNQSQSCEPRVSTRCARARCSPARRGLRRPPATRTAGLSAAGRHASITVEPKDVPVTYEYVAQTAGFREVEVRARVTGILLKRNYREGAPVKQGESLFTIDPAPFQVALARAEARPRRRGSAARAGEARGRRGCGPCSKRRP